MDNNNFDITLGFKDIITRRHRLAGYRLYKLSQARKSSFLTVVRFAIYIIIAIAFLLSLLTVWTNDVTANLNNKIAHDHKPFHFTRAR